MHPFILGQYDLLRWTPYAEAIAANYRSVSQFFLNVPTTLSDVADERKTVTVPAHQYDRLFFAAHVQACVSGGEAGDDIITEDGADDVITEDAADDVVTEGGGATQSMCGGQQVYLQVSDDRTGIKWASNAPINAAPMSAYGGSSEEVMPFVQLPEVFFLPKNVSLRFDFSVLNETMDGGRITWVGVQLADGEAPAYVDIPQGRVKVGSRVPWFAVIGLGRQQVNLSNDFQFSSGRRFLAYTQPTECDVEVTDIHGQFVAAVDELGDPDLIQFALAETGQRRLWTQTFTPSRDFLGDTAKAFPVMPLPAPYLLKAGRKLELSAFNNVSGVGIVDGFVVIRGVQRCSL